MTTPQSRGNSLPRTVLGNTGREISKLGFGGIPIQMVSEGEAVAVVRECVVAGINFFDTARTYTNSEVRVGKALEGIRERVFIATKTASRERAKVEKDLATSLSNLRTDYLDLYQFHNVATEEALEAIFVPGGPVDFVKEQKAKGVVRHIGVTSHSPEIALRAIKTGVFETIQFPFNYIERQADELHAEARRRGMGIIVMKPLAGGGLGDRADLARASVKWIAAQDLSVLIPGVKSIEEVRANVDAVLSGAPTAAEMALLEQTKQELGPVFCRRCGYCAPCPNDIPVNWLSSAEFWFKRAGWQRMDESHIKNFLAGLECQACGTCESRCPYNLPLSRLIPQYSKKLLLRAVELGKIGREEAMAAIVAAGRQDEN